MKVVPKPSGTFELSLKEHKGEHCKEDIDPHRKSEKRQECPHCVLVIFVFREHHDPNKGEEEDNGMKKQSTGCWAPVDSDAGNDAVHDTECRRVCDQKEDEGGVEGVFHFQTKRERHLLENVDSFP